jgi:hypothetical protein
MIIHSKIPQPSTGFFSLIIWPFVKMKAFVDEVYQGILSMIWAELIKHEEKQFSQLTHFIAFLVFSVFSMLFYHFEDLEDIIILSFFALWLIDTYLAKLGVKTNKYEQIVLETNDSGVIWKSFTPGESAIKEHFKPADITQISLTPLTLIGGAFRTVPTHRWQIFIIINDLDGYLIYQEKNAKRALKKARDLAHHFNVPLEIANSEGYGDYAAEKISNIGNRQTDYSNFWKTTQTSTAVKIYKKFSVATVTKVIKSVLEEAGVFLFIIIMAGVMVRFGMLLTFIIGPKIGIEAPTLVLRISFAGVLSFFAPRIDWTSLVAFTFAIVMLFYNGWKHSREHRITIDRKWLRYRIKGQSLVQLATQEINQLILLTDPKPALLLIDCHGKLITITELEDQEECEELYHRI